jgi:uncharacterized membrane protein
VQAYPWLVFFHLLGAFGFVFAHGSSAFISFRLRRERNVDRIAAMLELTNLSAGLMYPSLAILLIAGILAGLAGRWFSQGWIWAALALLIVITVAMFAIATPYYNRLRRLAGLPGRDRRRAVPARASEAEIATALQSRRPEVLALIGTVGLILLIWLMVLKPF